MRFQINCQKLASLLLASCALSGSLHSTSVAEGADGGASAHIDDAQQTGLIELATKPYFGGVSTASGGEIAGSRSIGSGALTAGVLVAQPPKNPSQVPLPAVTGPVELNNQAADGKKSENSLTPIQNRELTTNVHVVDMSVTGLGTGTIPAAAFDKRQAEATYERFVGQKCVYWHPSSICHYPLRYEETMLERHGHVRLGRLQPLISGVRFFTTIPMLPYLNTLQPYYQPVYALGNYRPGSCAPLLRDTIPYDRNAAVVEALAGAGYFWAMPL